MMKAMSAKNTDTPHRSGNLDKYYSRNPLKRYLTQRMENRLVALAAPYGIRILDAGAGEGITAQRLASRCPEARITLLDVSEGALAYAAEHCPSNCEYVCGDVMQMPFEDERFDLVICSEVLEHLPSPEDALKELRRVSRGAVLLSVPWEPWFRLGNMLSLKNLSRLGNPPDHINHWTHSGFRRWLLSHRGGWSVRLWVSFPWTIALLRKAPDT